MSNVKIIAIDYDGTLTHGDNYPNCLNPVYAAFHALKKFRSNGGKVILWTCRTGEALEEAVKFCKDLGLEFDAVNDNLPEQSRWWREKNPGIAMSRKIYADLYIDDHDPIAARDGIDWKYIDKLING